MSSEKMISLPVSLGDSESVLLYFKKDAGHQVVLSRIWEPDADYMMYVDYQEWGFTCTLDKNGVVELGETFRVPRTSAAYAEVEQIMARASEFYASEADGILDRQRRIDAFNTQIEEDVADFLLMGPTDLNVLSGRLTEAIRDGGYGFSWSGDSYGKRPWRGQMDGYVKAKDGTEFYVSESAEGNTEFEVKVRLLLRVMGAETNPVYEELLDYYRKRGN